MSVTEWNPKHVQKLMQLPRVSLFYHLTLNTDYLTKEPAKFKIMAEEAKTQFGIKACSDISHLHNSVVSMSHLFAAYKERRENLLPKQRFFVLRRIQIGLDQIDSGEVFSPLDPFNREVTQTGGGKPFTVNGYSIDDLLGTVGVREKKYWLAGHTVLKRKCQAHVTGCVQLVWGGLQSMLDEELKESFIKKKDLRDTWKVDPDPLLECIPTIPILDVDLWKVVVTQLYQSPASIGEVQKMLKYSNTTNYPCSQVVGGKTVAECAGRKSKSPHVSNLNIKHSRRSLSTSYLQNQQRKLTICKRGKDGKLLPKSSTVYKPTVPLPTVTKAEKPPQRSDAAGKPPLKSSTVPKPSMPKQTLCKAEKPAPKSKALPSKFSSTPVLSPQPVKHIVALNTSQPKNEEGTKITLDDAITHMKNNPDSARELLMPKLVRCLSNPHFRFVECPKISWEDVLSELCKKNKGRLLYASQKKDAYLEFLQLFSLLTPFHFSNPDTTLKLSICPFSTKLVPDLDNQIAGGLKFKSICEGCRMTNWMTPYEMLFHVMTKHGELDRGLFGGFFHACVLKATNNPIPLYDHQILTIMKICAFGWRLKVDMKLGNPVLRLTNTCASDTFLF
jgi:hypothetical protein